jgi:hypothetical protein
VLRNLTLILAVPALFRLVGWQALSGLYLLDSILTLFFYASVHWAQRESAPEDGKQTLLRAGIAAGLLVPIFVQLQSGIYHNPGPLMVDSGGSVMIVPLPLSLVAAFAGTVLLARYREATTALGVVFFLFVGMVFATILTTHGSVDYESRKLVLLFQYLIPVSALVLGEMYLADDAALRVCAKAFLSVVTAVVPFQLGLSLVDSQIFLAHHLVLFTIYQHRQFVAVVFVCAYLVAAFVLWDDPRHRSWLLALAPVMGAYAAASYSTLAFVFLVGGLAVLAVARARAVAVHACLLLAVGAAGVCFYLERNTYTFQEKYTLFRPAEAPSPPEGVAASRAGEETEEFELPRNVRQRFADWELYGRGIVESWRTALFGHAKAFDRAVSTSAHNYYLDFLYNFGSIAFLPLAWLLLHTGRLLWRERRRVAGDLPLLGLALVVALLVVVDNNFKVTFRQPYPGLFGFFLWGLLLARLAPSSRRA